MTCHDARERFSELVDERLAAPDRAAVDAHLVECAACRAELDAFRATVALVRSVGPSRAPATFAERVIAAARQPQPMRAPRRRLIDRLLFPLPVKLPLQAAAVMLVGVGVAYLFQHTPELQQATRIEPPTVAEQPAVPATPSAPAPVGERLAPEPRAADTRERDQLAARTDVPEQKAKSEAEAPTSSVDAHRKETASPREADAAAKKDAGAAPPPPMPAAVQAPRPQIELRQQAPGVGSSAPRVQATGELMRRSIAKTAAPPDVSGTLTVSSRATAEAALRELIARHRGRLLDSTVDTGGTTIELLITRAAFTAFVADLETLGRWRVDRPATSVPDEVRITVRVSE